MSGLVRYRNVVYDSARWEGFPFRADDVVISTPPKSGTTWMQMLCAMLILETTEFDRPLRKITPWVDMQGNDLAEVIASLVAQQHRRFVKTHTPLDGLPIANGVTYVCVGRDPRDVALSYHNHSANMDVETFMAARAAAVGIGDLAALGSRPTLPDDPLERFSLWMDAEPDRFIGPGLVDVLHHLQTFWDRRHDPQVHLFHYSDLLSDLGGGLRRLADALSIRVTDQQVERYVTAGTFDNMKQRADELAPGVDNLWHSNDEFFHRGSSGQWRDLLDDASLRRYQRRVNELVPPDLAAWSHQGWSGSDVVE